ncbi:MAG: hypothetical protein H6719_25805 [Sandaracinaceae bacterium]|nr:hypothetical protein [Sandaracinaceae bacterium]
MAERTSVLVPPGSFEPEEHFYPRVLNAQIHPLVRYFLGLDNERIAARYAHLHPLVPIEAVREVLASKTTHFRWGGADLFHAADPRGGRKMYVIETNSCPSGQKSIPRMEESQEQGGYRRLLEDAFLPMLRRRGLPTGVLAVLWDKNYMETSGYAAVLADLAKEDVWLVPCFDGEENPWMRINDRRTIEIRTPAGDWLEVRAAFRYVTQRPWNRIPPVTRTLVFNPVVVCLAGGRNKMLAAKAYDLYNAKIADKNLRIEVPETIWDVSREEIPMWVERMGGFAVVKNPYSNAGQGVWTITSQRELDALMEIEQRYDRFIVQQLIGNVGWSSRGRRGPIYHVGTVPNRKNKLFVADVRFMVGCGPGGFFPCAIYARRARESLEAAAPTNSWEVLGTNLSIKNPDGSWSTESERLVLMDARDFNRLGVGLDDLIDGYMQTVLSVSAIDSMATRLITSKGRFGRKLFQSINPDESLVAEVMP